MYVCMKLLPVLVQNGCTLRHCGPNQEIRPHAITSVSTMNLCMKSKFDRFFFFFFFQFLKCKSHLV